MGMHIPHERWYESQKIKFTPSFTKSAINADVNDIAVDSNIRFSISDM